MANYNFQLTATESTVINAIADCAIALKTFHTNEVKSGVLAAEVSEAAQTCGIVLLAAGSLVAYAARQTAIWAVFACLFTLHCWAEDSKERALIAAHLAVPLVETEPVSIGRELAKFIIRLLKFGVWVERSAIALYFAYLSRWAQLQRSVRSFAC